MCGRFLLLSELKDLIKYYAIENQTIGGYKPGDFYPSKNTPIVLNKSKKTISYAKWGFLYGNKKGLVINARAESIMNKPMFKNAFYSRRCVIPANLFYEWKDEGAGKKIKHKIGLQHDRLISLGGIYNISPDDNSKEQLAYVIITTEAAEDLKSIHPRMPLIIKNDQLDLWLNKSTSIKHIEEILSNNANHLFTVEKHTDATKTVKDNIHGQIVLPGYLDIK